MFEPTIPRIIARTMIPPTSSITAPARMVTPSGDSIFFFSERILAVIPTEVAVAIAPKKSVCGEKKPIDLPNSGLEKNKATSIPKRKEKIIPPTPTKPPTTLYLINRFKSVSTPEIKSRIIEAIVEIP